MGTIRASLVWKIMHCQSSSFQNTMSGNQISLQVSCDVCRKQYLLLQSLAGVTGANINKHRAALVKRPLTTLETGLILTEEMTQTRELSMIHSVAEVCHQLFTYRKSKIRLINSVLAIWKGKSFCRTGVAVVRWTQFLGNDPS